MKSLVCVFLLLLVLVEVMCCEGCLKQEREALVALNSHLVNAMYSPNTNTDCCEWEGIECNTTTGRVAKLRLHAHIESLNYSDFAIFKDLKTLNLSSSGICTCSRTEYQGYFSCKVKMNLFLT